jgi:hypothetical protein
VQIASTRKNDGGHIVTARPGRVHAAQDMAGAKRRSSREATEPHGHWFGDFKDTAFARFVPAVCIVMIYLYVMTYEHGPLSADVLMASPHNSSFVATPLGNLWDEVFSKYWPMTLAMVLGSLIAGSTPLGGGVVAFPVAVLVIGFKPGEGRDFTVLIQTVGMNCAAYLIVAYKPQYPRSRGATPRHAA